jgi:hypothetical protein
MRDEKNLLHDVVQIRSGDAHPQQEARYEPRVLPEEIGRAEVAACLQSVGVSFRVNAPMWLIRHGMAQIVPDAGNSWESP